MADEIGVCIVLSAGRTKHPVKGLEQVIREAELRGWRVARRARSDFTMKCPCPGLHQKTVKVNPSSPLYERELRRHLSRATCWDG